MITNTITKPIEREEWKGEISIRIVVQEGVDQLDTSDAKQNEILSQARKEMDTIMREGIPE